jgi:uncharacterized membrane protein YgaE (UPF0421/DUF939 family)
MPLHKNDVPSFKYIQEKIGNPIGITLNAPYFLGFQAGWFNCSEELKKDLFAFLDAEEKETDEGIIILKGELRNINAWCGYLDEEINDLKSQIYALNKKKEFIAQIREIVTRKRFT